MCVIAVPLEAANWIAACVFDQLYQWRESNAWLCSYR